MVLDERDFWWEMGGHVGVPLLKCSNKDKTSDSLPKIGYYVICRCSKQLIVILMIIGIAVQY